MSNRRGERRVFRPPGRIDDDSNNASETKSSSGSADREESGTWQTDLFQPGKDEGETMDALLQGISTSQAQIDVLLGAGGAAEKDNLSHSYDQAKGKNKSALPSGSASKAHMDAVKRESSGAVAQGSVSKAHMDKLLGAAGGGSSSLAEEFNRPYDFEKSGQQTQSTDNMEQALHSIKFKGSSQKLKPNKSVTETDKFKGSSQKLKPNKSVTITETDKFKGSSQKLKPNKSVTITEMDKKLADQLDVLLAGDGDDLPQALKKLSLSTVRYDAQTSASNLSTLSPQSSSLKKKEKDKKSKKLEWTANEVFIVPPTNKTPQQEGTVLAASSDNLPSISDVDASPRRKKKSLKKSQSMRIDNKEKLETRWTWNQERVAREFLRYKKMLAEDDELLPNPDEFDSFQDVAENEHYYKVRDEMLEDGTLNEREIAAFFEGLAFFDVKVKSLQSQLESLKAVKRSEDTRELMRRQSFKSKSSSNLKTKVPRAHPTSLQNITDTKEHIPSDSVPSFKTTLVATKSDGMLTGGRPKSLRAMSIKKFQVENKDDVELQRLLKELEEAEKKQKKLEKQIQQAGLVIAEDIPYGEAKSHVERVAIRMQEIGSSEVTHEDKAEQSKLREEYFRLEQDMEKYNTALMMTDEWIEEQEEMEQKWEDDNASDNEEALKKLRRHMPVNVKSLSEAQLCSDESPNGKHLSKIMAKKFKRTNVLQMLRTSPEDIMRMHPSTLENLRVTGLTLTERRAIYAHLKDVGPRWKAMQAEQMTERKWTWYKMMKTNFEENLGSYLRHVAQYGPPGSHPYATRDKPNEGCPLLGKQCHLKADKLMDYDNDYGYSSEAEYEVSSVRKADKEEPGAKALREALELTREKKSGERGTLMKQHYKGKLLQVSLANGSCESMDESIDNMEFLRRKWIEDRLMNGEEVTDEFRRKELSAFSDALNELKLSLLAFAERSGMQLTGKKDSNADQPDIRSSIELGLSEEVCETSLDFFEDIDDRMRGMSAKDGRLKSTIDQLRELLDELHERNVATLKELGVDRPDRSRKLKSTAEITREIKKTVHSKESPKVEEGSHRSPSGGPGRGGLMAALQGGRGGGDQGGRGGMMAALAGRGRGGGDDQGGRGGMMAALAGRGRGGGDDQGGRGGLMAALAGRGRGKGGGGDQGGRGGLMAALAARGRGDRYAGAAGRGDLMSQLAARGRGRGRESSGRGDLASELVARGRGAMQHDLMSQLAARGPGRGGGGGGFLAELQARERGGGEDT